MPEEFDFIVVGGGSAGAVIASRLSEDRACRVVLIEAGERPPQISTMPIAPPVLQLDPATDWMFTADPGKAGLGLNGGRVPVPRGKMLGGSSGINYMVYVRGHPGDFDAWAEGGAAGWSYADVLPYFRKSEGLAPSGDIVVDAPAHNTAGPLGVSVRDPLLPAARQFVEAAVAAGIPRGDYNGRDRGGPAGVVSLTQMTTRRGKRSSTYFAFLEGEPEARPNLTIITGAQATRVILSGGPGQPAAAGVEYRTVAGETRTVHAAKEVILSAGAVGSPQLLLLSGIGPRQELAAIGIPCRVDSPHVGKHLKDHLMCSLVYPAPGIGISMSEIGLAMGPGCAARRRRTAAGRSRRRRDALARSAGIERGSGTAPDRVAERADAGWPRHLWSMPWSSARPASAICTATTPEIMCFVTGGDDDLQRRILEHRHGALFRRCVGAAGAETENLLLLANPVLPHSEGEIVLDSADPLAQPAIRMNYYDDPHDMRVMVAAMRQTMEIAAHWPGNRKLGPLMVPPFLAEKHGYRPGAELSDALLEDWRSPLLADGLSPDLDLPDRRGRRSAAAGEGNRTAAGGRRQRDAQRDQRQY